MKILVTTLTALLTFMVTTTAQAFCGFYVAKADTSLFNQASQVVLVRDGDRTVITMANDFEGNVEDFAIVIPVPTLIEREQITSRCIHIATPGRVPRWKSLHGVRPRGNDECRFAIPGCGESAETLGAFQGRNDRGTVHGW
jgi:hypothetical protein